MNLNVQRKLFFGLRQNYVFAHNLLSKFSLTMKITAFLLMVVCMQISAKTFSQRITISASNTSLKFVLLEIRKQSGLKLVYNTDVLQRAQPVTVSLKEATLTETMDKVMANQPFNYEIEGNTILINPKTTKVRVVTAAPQIVVTGKVTDGKGPLPGASITEKNTKNVTKTDINGQFTLKVDKEGAILVVSYIGFNRKEVAATSTFMNIVLEGGDQSLGEVVVTGYQKVDKKTFTGSVSQVDKEIINRSGYTDVSRMLQGAAAGVSVENVSGTFGATPKIRIRGNASISANQEPLYVINGIPIASPANVNVSQLYSGDPASLLGSAIAGLNAADIEDISILKDGSATALYGTRAANGVISITTKKGKKNSASINLSTAYTIGVKPDINQFNVMDSKQSMDLSQDLYNYGYLSVLNYPSSTGAFTEPYRLYASNQISPQEFNNRLNRARGLNTDWFDVLFKNNLLQEHSLSFSGGGDKSTYYLSGSYAGDNGSAIGYNMNRYTSDFRVVLNLTSKLDLDLNLNASFRDQLSPGTFNSTTSSSSFNTTRLFDLNPTSYAANTSRAMSPYDANGNLQYYLRDFAPFNILDELKENFNTLSAHDVRISVKPTYKISKDLTFETLLSARKTAAKYDHVMTEYSNVAAAYRVATNDKLREMNPFLYKDPSDPNSIPETILPRGGILDARSNDGRFLYMRNTLSFKKDWEDKHRLNVFGGFEMASDKTTSDYTRGYGYLYYGGKIISPSVLAMKRAIEKDERYYTEGFVQENRTALFLSTQYSFNNKYNIEVAGRVDGNNMFGRRTRSRFLPNYSVGLSWNVDQENFFKQINAAGKINFMKLRASYALRGNAYQSSPNINANYVNVNRPDAVNSEIGIRILAPELFSLSWEKDFITNFGLELGLFNKLSLTAEYYTRKNKDLIRSSSVGYEDGFASKTINWATMSNKGVDITLDVKEVVKTKDFRWNVGLIYGYVKNTMVDGNLFSPLLTEKTRPDGYGIVGKPLYGLYAYRFASLDANGQPLFYDGNTGKTSNNIQFSSVNDSLITYMGSRIPTSTGSITNSFNYKSFELRVFLTYSMGNKVFRSPTVKRVYDDNLAASKDIDSRWRTAGDENLTNIPGLVSSIQNSYFTSAFIENEFAYNRSDAMVVSANVLRLSEVMLSYNVSPKLLTGVPWIKGARLMASANNIHYWASSKLRGVDPQSLISGVSLPNPRSYTLRLTAQF
ncbi:TonB-linked outer membrane protein, SusC/RagA family [Pedobacter sp. ok626]|uniref:SusC/RagA family TonB-linked outer membrane protein n=1 Tax=Pedobacter sp. ok626 TaxID=1761882 RepID=UPI00088037E0|nr:SusC/RagA family TonB-linked outer membrane protein [Pedobacter sp. ok626]SDJ27039.1 TonB-linked outer membrane protein, SusC/RagA family [Pedobacter sp. ok626]